MVNLSPTPAINRAMLNVLKMVALGASRPSSRRSLASSANAAADFQAKLLKQVNCKGLAELWVVSAGG
jgi:hypothetical protein